MKTNKYLAIYRIYKYLWILLIVLCSKVTAQIDSIANKFFSYGYFVQGKDTLPYRFYIPENQPNNKTYQPVSTLIFLHGSGERGNNNVSQLMHMGFWLMNAAIDNNMAVFIPQCSSNDYWSNVIKTAKKNGKTKFQFQEAGAPTIAMKLLMGLTDSLKKQPWFNPKQVYVGGLSMGGMGTVEICKRKPDFFQAAFPICGGGNIPNPNPKMRWWIFHGNKDKVVSIKHSRKLIRQLHFAHVTDVKLSIYSGVGHNAWDYVKLEPDFWQWLLNPSLIPSSTK